MLLIEVAHFEHQQIRRVGWAFDLEALLMLGQQQPPADFQRCFECRSLGLTHAVALA